MSKDAGKSPDEWASEVPDSENVSLGDIERVIATYRGASDEDLIPGKPRVRNSNMPAWLFIGLLLAVFIVPLFGAAQYWGGGGGIRGGNLSVEYDPGRASLIVPACFAVMTFWLIYNIVSWVRGGRNPGGGVLFYPLYFGVCAGAGLLLANVRGVKFANGGEIELMSMWVCFGVAVAHLGGYLFGVKRTEMARQMRARRDLKSKMVWDRISAGKILVSRGLIGKSDYDQMMDAPFGTFMREEGR
ncbi:MAG: hypothetical protein ACRDSJ_25250 [Rubrobacteraceae bacterium]